MFQWALGRERHPLLTDEETGLGTLNRSREKVQVGPVTGKPLKGPLGLAESDCPGAQHGKSPGFLFYNKNPNDTLAQPISHLGSFCFYSPTWKKMQMSSIPAFIFDYFLVKASR